MNTDSLLKLYEIVVNEEHHFLDAHQDRIGFFSGFMTALIAGIGFGLFQASQWYHFVALCVGPVLLFALSSIAIDGAFRMYQRFLETVTIRAKIEQHLGLTKPGSENTNDYWQSEPIIPSRHVESRKRFESSDAFLKELSVKGYHKTTLRIFRGVQWLSGLMLIGLLALATSEIMKIV